MKKWLTFGLGAVVSVGIFVALVGSELGAVKDELVRARYIYLIPCALLLIAGLLTRAMRWQILLDGRVSVWHSFHIMNVGYFVSSILPFRIGDLARAWLTTRLRPPVSSFSSLSTIVIERLVDLLFVVLVLGGCLIVLDVPTEVTSVGVLMGTAALVALITLSLFAARPEWAKLILKRIEGWLPILEPLNLDHRLDHILKGIAPIGRPKTALTVICWTAFSWFFSILAGYALLFILFDKPTIEAAALFVVLGSFSVALPAVPGNLGPFEGAVVGGLWIAGLIEQASAPENAPAIAFAAILHALLIALYIFFGLIGLYVEHTSVRQVRRGASTLTEHETNVKILAEGVS